MNSERADVALIRCDDYESKKLDRAIETCAEIAGFPDIKDKIILIKPNVLNASPASKAVTTNPAFVEAVVRFVKSRGAKEILVGDSPGWQPVLLAAKTSGIYDAVQQSGGTWVDFREVSPHPVVDGKKLKNIPLTALLEKVDLVINLPKLKNHSLTTYTGAIKNLFGLIPGTAKSAMHLQYPAVIDFGEMLVDLALSIPNCFTFMDAIIAMDGQGPGSGTPYSLGIVLASMSVAKLDWIASQCVGYDPKNISYILDSMQRTLGSANVPEPSTYPLRVSEVEHSGFKRLPYTSKLGRRLSSIPRGLRSFAAKFIHLRPIFHKNKCIGCSACITICPAKVLVLDRKNGSNIIRINDKLCITCFCCHEVCPAKAISVGRAPIRIVHRRLPGN
ncbi:MAG TPA: DUF362 domain-containing protein [Rectinema sp.]|nr:DUF362 domain-containing protein [Rectinema sp.]